MRKFVALFAVVFGLMCLGGIPVSAAEAAADGGTGAERDIGDGKDYDELNDKIWNDTGETLGQLADTGSALGKDAVKTVWVYIFYVYDVVSGIYPALLILSLTVGSLVAILSTKNKRRRRYAIVVGCITIPLITTLIVYVLPYIYIRLS